ncbi:MAG: cation:proton antiporter, partial [Puniceicoccales bacterium]|nr:cation:proton antiporter [Puniceicoccales bacterium]
MEAGSLLQDLTIVLVGAGISALVFSFLRWPLILGYILAGILIGPHFTTPSLIHNDDTIREISELGVIFLMFYAGLDFDIKRIQQTLLPALSAMGLQLFSSVVLGIIFARLMDWSALQSVFLAGVLAVSSTMVTIPILKAKNAMKSNYAQLSIGVAISEDVVGVLLLAFLAGISRANKMEWMFVFRMTFSVMVLVAALFFVGRLWATRFMMALSRLPSEEILHIVLVGLILLVGQLARSFSVPLGAFVAGAIFAGTHFAEKFDRITTPMRDIFTAIFFVSIGMLVVPSAVWQHKGIVLLLSLATFLGMVGSVWLGLYFAGQRGSVAFKASLSKAQIGEFSFVIAALG